MPIIATNEGGEKTLIPEGNHVAICYKMVYMGTIPEEYNGEMKKQKKIVLSWEFPTLQHVFKEENGPQPFSIHQTYTLSTDEKSNLRRDLQAWRGKPFTEEEVKAFDVEKVLGAHCMIQVGTKEKKSGGKTSYIQSIASVPQGLDKPQRINDLFRFSNTPKDFDPMLLELLPDWQQTKIKSSEEFRLMEQGEAPMPSEDEASGAEKVADDLPF